MIALPRRRFVVRKAIAAAIAAAMLFALPVAASATALPGSPFYGLKQRLERAQLWFARGPVADGFVHVSHANRRLDEVKQLVALGTTDRVPDTLDRMDRSLRVGAGMILRNARDDATLRRLAKELRRSNGRLSVLYEVAPDAVRSELLEALASGKALVQVVSEALGDGTAAPRLRRSPEGGTATGFAFDFSAGGTIPTNGGIPVDGSGGPGADPSQPGGRQPGEGVDSPSTSAPCVATVYAGPGSGDVEGSLCPTVSNEKSGDDSQVTGDDGVLSRIPPEL